MIRLALPGCLCVLLLACSGDRPAPRETAGPGWASTRDALIEEYLAANPGFAVSLGRHEYDGKLPDWSASGITVEIARVRAARDRIAALTGLDDAERFERDYLVAVFEGDLFWLETAESPFTNPAWYLQFLHANRSQSLVGRLFVGYAFAEGWGHYAEEMSWEMGLGNGDPETHVGQLTNALLRNARLLSAIGLHTRGMTVAESEKVFREQAYVDAGNARQQAARGTYDPAYLNYTMGKLDRQPRRACRVAHVPRRGPEVRRAADPVDQGAHAGHVGRRAVLIPGT
jgi:hypothetical protein